MAEKAPIEQLVAAAINRILGKVEPSARLRVLADVAAEISSDGGGLEPPHWEPLAFISGDFTENVRQVSITGPDPVESAKLRVLVKQQEEGLGSIVWVMRFVDRRQTAMAVKFYSDTGAALWTCLEKEVFKPLNLPIGQVDKRAICGLASPVCRPT
ncbi:hypothetical protein ACFWXH_19440 [Mesorhizobium sp. NPDC059054]|uniref:hypothetical protein n=1 Tax=Mesorhizobium sp. NPDC059054 TaxID=3346711 RepID=UPI003696D465